MKKILVGLAMAVLLNLGVSNLGVQAVSIFEDPGVDQELKDAAGCSTTSTVGGVANTIINIVLSLVGVIAVGVMIYGGVLYMTSAGDAGKARRARDVILYGLVGLIVALLAFAIVTFVGKGVSG